MDANVMDTEKKVYNTPKLVEHGSLSEVTQNNCGAALYDAYYGQPNFGDSSPDVCI